MNCPSCNQVNRQGARFCGTCGSVLGAVSADAAPVSQAFPASETASAAAKYPPLWLPELAMGLMAISAGVLAFIWRPIWASYFSQLRYSPGYLFSSFGIVSLLVSLALVGLLVTTGATFVLKKTANPVLAYATAGVMAVGTLFVSLSVVADSYWLFMWEPFASYARGRLGRVIFGIIGTAASVALAAFTSNPRLVGSSSVGNAHNAKRVANAPRTLPPGMAPCSVGSRIGAAAIDGAIRGGVWTFFYFAIIVAVLGALSAESSAPLVVVPIAALVFFIPPWNTIWRQGNRGQSVGKGVTRLMLVRNDGSEVNKATVFGRAVLGTLASVITFGIFAIVEIIVTWIDPIHQRLIDRLLGLHVVNADSVPTARGFITPNIARPESPA
jgi:uncharacterized RDD family membrane protein YckC